MKTKKIIVIPDSFKSTFSSLELCNKIKNKILVKHQNYQVINIPIADGGEGTVESYYNIFGGSIYHIMVNNAFYKTIEASYVIINDYAVMEVANIVGYKQNDILNPSIATTFGVGEVIKDILKHNIKTIYIGLGGSITNDGGCGMACSLGVNFYNQFGESFIPAGISLKDIVKIDTTNIMKELNNVKVIALCDVNNILYGKTGASYIYARQKGATDNDIILLDEGLENFSKVVNNTYKVDIANFSGAGAAGGLGAGIKFFLNGEIKSGIDVLLKQCNFEALSKDADLIITGEGKLDFQSLNGKVLQGIAKLSKGISKIALVGTSILEEEDLKKLGIVKVYETNSKHLDFNMIKNSINEDLDKTINEIIKDV